MTEGNPMYEVYRPDNLSRRGDYFALTGQKLHNVPDSVKVSAISP